MHDHALIDIQDQWSALLLATRHGHTKVVEVLLNAGASMTVSNKVRAIRGIGHDIESVSVSL